MARFDPSALVGSIPTPVGEPLAEVRFRRIVRVYPHACGGTTRDLRTDVSTRGLSPRLWGNRGGDSGLRRQQGSIPTPVGEPRTPAARTPRRRVYPHACGGTPLHSQRMGRPAGLSPRLWGNLVPAPAIRPERGSIPTPVGEPTLYKCVDSEHWVYPHACGGTCRSETCSPWIRGLSPRLWGNLSEMVDREALEGSIPTPVGEPLDHNCCVFSDFKELDLTKRT